MSKGVFCDYCREPAKLVGGDVIYPHRPDLSAKKFWHCLPCQAYVGCHPGTEKKLGRLANADLRRAKMRAHAAFDPFWKSGKMTRRQAYTVLADALGLPKEKTHIGYFDIPMCDRVVAACQAFDA